MPSSKGDNEGSAAAAAMNDVLCNDIDMEALYMLPDFPQNALSDAFSPPTATSDASSPSKRQKNQSSPSLLEILPNEVLTTIMLRLSVVDLLNIDCTCTRFWTKIIEPEPTGEREVRDLAREPDRWSLASDVARGKLKHYDDYLHPLLHNIPNPKKCYIWILYQIEALRSGSPFFRHYADERLASTSKSGEFTNDLYFHTGRSSAHNMPIALSDPIPNDSYIQPVYHLSVECMNSTPFYIGLVAPEIMNIDSASSGNLFLKSMEQITHHLFHTGGFFCGSNNALSNVQNFGAKNTRRESCPCPCLKKNDVVTLVLDSVKGTLCIYHNGKLCTNNNGVMANKLSGKYCWILILPTNASVQIIPSRSVRTHIRTYLL